MNETELRKLNDEMVGAYMDQNTDIILSHCSEDVLMHDSGQEPVRGKDACRDYLVTRFSHMSSQSATHIKRIFDDDAVFGELDWTATKPAICRCRMGPLFRQPARPCISRWPITHGSTTQERSRRSGAIRTLPA